MPGYVEGAIYEYKHNITTHHHHKPHKLERLDYMTKTQWETNKSDKLILSPEERKYTQNLVGKLIYYVREVDPAMLV